jgi:metal-responsive CopG/Arc/MetJ family transcriptional regulator
MARPRKDPLEVKIPMSIGIKKKLVIAFDAKIEELGLNRSNTMESLIEQFLQE